MSFKRRAAREKVLQALYAYELSQEPIEVIMDNLFSSLQKQPSSHAFARQLTLKAINCSKELDEIIKRHVENWEFNRLATIDRIVLRMGICELLYFEDIPPKVTINEAIEIARKFSTDKSDKFVNGVLDSVLEELTGQGKIRKSGRGLVDSPPKKSKRSSKNDSQE